MGSSVPDFHDSEPKLTISGTTVTPHSAALSTGMSEAESVTIATAGMAKRALRRHALERHRDGSTTAEAERREPVPTVAPLELVEQRRDDAGPARADGVAERDCAAVDIDLRPIEPELAAVGERLGGECLVDLDQVERLDRQLDLCQQLPDALHRREKEPLWRDLRLGISDDPGKRFEA